MGALFASSRFMPPGRGLRFRRMRAFLNGRHGPAVSRAPRWPEFGIAAAGRYPDRTVRGELPRGPTWEAPS